MSEIKMSAVTGAFGYSGKYITRRLLAKGEKVITLTNSLHRPNPFGGAVRAYPYHFDDPGKLREVLQGVSVLYNTYWVRFNYKTFTHAETIKNSLTLFNAAREAGVERIVHVSITNPSIDSNLEYFSGKAKLEEALKESGLSYSILRPTVLFGEEDILVNNIAWALRKLPVFGVFGKGTYRIRPIFVDDLAALAVEQGESKENIIIDAVGPETFTYKQFVKIIADIIGKKRLIIPVPPMVGFLVLHLLGKLMGDVMITREEIDGLMTERLYVDSPSAGKTKFKEWARTHADTLGRKYASELARRKTNLSGMEIR
jgi:uncharacterized protein YbjT (DUF2867 family)